MISLRCVAKAVGFTLLLGQASAECKSLPPGHEMGKTTKVSIESEGVERSFLLTIPVLYDCEKATPLILSYHGESRDASQQLELSQMSNPFFNDFALVAYPQAANGVWQSSPDAVEEDLAFTTNILNYLEHNYWIDTQRVWATGKSDGAGFVNSLACDWALSKRIAAFAPVAGDFTTKTDTCDADSIILKCNPGRRKVPIIEFHGAKDDKALYGGGELKKRECLPSIEHFMHDWAMRNSLGPKYVTTQPKKDTFVHKYGRDLEHGLVTLVVDTAIGHEWPSTTPNLDNTQPGKRRATFDATRVIIDFFQAHPLFTPMNVIVQRSPVSASGIPTPSIVPSSIPSFIPKPHHPW